MFMVLHVRTMTKPLHIPLPPVLGTKRILLGPCFLLYCTFWRRGNATLISVIRFAL